MSNPTRSKYSPELFVSSPRRGYNNYKEHDVWWELQGFWQGSSHPGLYVTQIYELLPGYEIPNGMYREMLRRAGKRAVSRCCSLWYIHSITRWSRTGGFEGGLAEIFGSQEDLLGHLYQTIKIYRDVITGA